MSEYLRELEQKHKDYVNRDLIAFYIGITMELKTYKDGTSKQIDYVENGTYPEPELSQEWRKDFTKKSDRLYNEMCEFVTEHYMPDENGIVNRKDAIIRFKANSENIRNMKLDSETLKMMIDKAMLDIYSVKYYSQKKISGTNYKNSYFGVVPN